jgi:hypothetical protein
MSTLDMNNSINALEEIALPASPDPNLITIEEIVVLSASIIEEDEMAASITNIEWIQILTSELRDVEMIFLCVFFNDNDKIFATFVENEYEKLFGIRINFSFYQNINYICYLVIKFEISYEEDRIIK